MIIQTEHIVKTYHIRFKNDLIDYSFQTPNGNESDDLIRSMKENIVEIRVFEDSLYFYERNNEYISFQFELDEYEKIIGRKLTSSLDCYERKEIDEIMDVIINYEVKK